MEFISTGVEWSIHNHNKRYASSGQNHSNSGISKRPHDNFPKHMKVVGILKAIHKKLSKTKYVDIDILNNMLDKAAEKKYSTDELLSVE